MPGGIQNLKPFPKGVSGNPGGRPKVLIAAALWKQLLKNGGADLEAVVKGIIHSAAKGNPKSFAAIRDSIDGKPKLAVEIDADITTNLAERLQRARNQVQDHGSAGS